jgi:hypothetical protein
MGSMISPLMLISFPISVYTPCSQGLAHVARHVIRCHFVQEEKEEEGEEDVEVVEEDEAEEEAEAEEEEGEEEEEKGKEEEEEDQEEEENSRNDGSKCVGWRGRHIRQALPVPPWRTQRGRAPRSCGGAGAAPSARGCC